MTVPSTRKSLGTTQVVFPEPCRVELEHIEVGLEDVGPLEVVVQARRIIISPGTEIARYHNDRERGVTG